jgi:hypothetical protein
VVLPQYPVLLKFYLYPLAVRRYLLFLIGWYTLPKPSFTSLPSTVCLHLQRDTMHCFQTTTWPQGQAHLCTHLPPGPQAHWSDPPSLTSIVYAH